MYNSVHAHVWLLATLNISQEMDIPDIEVVVVGGTPDILPQLYQVAYILHLKMCLFNIIQMFVGLRGMVAQHEAIYYMQQDQPSNFEIRFSGALLGKRTLRTANTGICLGC